MARAMKGLAACSALVTALTAALYIAFGAGPLLTLAIAAGTTAYHVCMRLAVGFLFNRVMGNRADYRRGWYQLRPQEEKLYERLNVKVWKSRLPTYDPEAFSLQRHTLEEIAQAMCQAEVVHEVIVVLSFLPLLASLKFGAPVVFAITSALAALADAMFVMAQRYNRSRIVRLAEQRRS